MVETVHYVDSAVPIPTSEVGIVSKALQTFIAWPKYLMRMTLYYTSVCVYTNIVTYVVFSFVVLCVAT